MGIRRNNSFHDENDLYMNEIQEPSVIIWIDSRETKDHYNHPKK